MDMLAGWAQTRKRMLQREAVETLRTQRVVGVIAHAMEGVGLPEPDTAWFSGGSAAGAARLTYLAVDDEERRRDLCRRARVMLAVKETAFQRHYVEGQQRAVTEGKLPDGTMVYVSVVLGMRENCHLEYEQVTTTRAKVVCN
jgi:hypothetical protein